MPYYGTKCGVYEANLTAGTEVSSTYEGRYLTFLSSELHGPNAAIVHGDPVFVDTLRGDIVGVAMTSQHATLDNLITIDTEGIWNLSVIARDDWGNVAIVPGDALYIDHQDIVGTIDRRQDPESHILFGYALGAVSSGNTAVIAVKVHWAPHENNILMGIVTNYTEDTTGRPRARIDSDYSALSGSHNGLDVRVGRTGAGANAAIVRAIHGYGFTSGVGTANAGWCLVTGVAGLASLGGTIINASGFFCGGFMQIFDSTPAGTLTTVAHMCALWCDFQASTLPTNRNGGVVAAHRGGAEILYLTNNSQTTIDSAIHIETFASPTENGLHSIFTFGDHTYGGGASGAPIRDGGTGNKTIKSGGDWKKIKVYIDIADTFTEYWLIAMSDPTES